VQKFNFSSWRGGYQLVLPRVLIKKKKSTICIFSECAKDLRGHVPKCLLLRYLLLISFREFSPFSSEVLMQTDINALRDSPPPS
jgi:hypothetical protein